MGYLTKTPLPLAAWDLGKKLGKSQHAVITLQTALLPCSAPKRGPTALLLVAGAHVLWFFC